MNKHWEALVKEGATVVGTGTGWPTSRMGSRKMVPLPLIHEGTELQR